MRALVTLALVVGLAGVSGCGAASSESPAETATASGGHVERVSGRQARALVAAGATLLDVRSGFEFAIGHIDGASNIPVDELARRSSELDRDAPVVVYCLSGHRSADAARTLERPASRTSTTWARCSRTDGRRPDLATDLSSHARARAGRRDRRADATVGDRGRRARARRRALVACRSLARLVRGSSEDRCFVVSR